MDYFWFALLLTTFAGLSTGIGSAIAFFTRSTNFRFLSVATGFSAGVMLYVSFLEILPSASQTLTSYSQHWADWLTAAAFFAGILFIFLIDNFIPSAQNPHEARPDTQIEAVHSGASPQKLLHTTPAALHRMGIFTAIAIAIHNFPEGLVVFLAPLEDPSLGIAVAIAVALHNIPEGISIAVPIYFATGRRRAAFTYSMLSGLAEPVGGVIGYLILQPFLGPVVMGSAFAAVAGIMVYISLDELLPASRAYGKNHDSIYGLLAGMLLMALTLLLIH